MGTQKTAVVIGATGNIGGAVVRALEDEGYYVDPTWKSADRPDCTKASSYKSLPPKIDVAIYLAGINRVGKAEELADGVWDEVFNINLKGAFLFARAAFPSMKAAGRSSFIAISSIMATHPYPHRLPYAASKAGLEGLVRSLAVEWGEHGIATQALRLGHITGLMKSTKTNPALLGAVKAKSPLGELISLEDVASYIVWLAGGGCHATSGNIMDFDPAYTINRWPLTE